MKRRKIVNPFEGKLIKCEDEFRKSGD